MINCQSTISGFTEVDEEKPPRASPLDNLNFFSNDINWNLINNELASIDWPSILSGNDPSYQLDVFMGKIISTCEKYVPQRKSPSRTGKPIDPT